jgi:hypothetical protein
MCVQSSLSAGLEQSARTKRNITDAAAHPRDVIEVVR